MKKLSKMIVKYKYWIIGICLLLLIPAGIGIYKTKINYDILVYLPEDIETMKGEQILTDDFKMGAYSMVVVDNMSSKDIIKLEDNIRNINGVEKVISINDITGSAIPKEMLPSKYIDKVYNDNSTLVFITFSESTSNESTLNAVEEIRNITSDSVKVGGMSAMVLDTMNLSNKEVVIYVVIAVLLCIIVLELSLDSYVVPFILLINIGIAILYNMGSNIILGNISYITKAISAVLQLGVTTDFSIFLYHRYEAAKKKEKNNDDAMEMAIRDTFSSVVGSSLTTIAGFLALCTMTLLLGKDIGLVMAKGVLLGVICVLTLFPALLLVFDKLVSKTTHKKILPEFRGVNNFVVKHYKGILVIFLILCIPAYIGNKNVKVYYNLDRSLPDTLEFSVANKALKDKFNIVSPEVILVDRNIKNNTVNEMVDKIKNVSGIDLVLSFSNISELGIPESDLPSDILKIFKSDKYQMLLVNSSYNIATDELNEQIGEINDIVKGYDSNAIVAGEGPLMKDMVNISNTDFMNVNTTSIIIIFILMCFVLKSFTLPIILVVTIEFAIFLNMAVSYYTGAVLPFISSIVIGTIQLGATIDYAILMTTKYLEARKSGKDKYEAVRYAMENSVSSIIVSGMCFFGATFGVGLVTKLEMIGSICSLISRGAIISMLVVINILPTLLLIFDKLIIKTTFGFKEAKVMKKKNLKKVMASALIIGMMIPNIVSAASKNETVYQKLDTDGNIVSTIVNEELIGISGDVVDESDLKDILNINGYEDYIKNDNTITWKNTNNNLFYQGTTSKELPVKLAMSYKLDGEEMSVKDMKGKSGHVVVKIEYTNTQKHDDVYTPFVVTMGTILKNDVNSNISINTGKIVSNGTSSVVVGIAAPGMAKSLNMDFDLDDLVIEFDTTSFEMPSIYNAISCNLISSDDLKVFDKLDGIYSKMDTLDKSSSELVSGSKNLYNGTSEYSKKFLEYKNGVKSLDAGVKSLVSNYNTINTGVISISSNIDKLGSLTSGISTIHDSIVAIKNGIIASKATINGMSGDILNIKTQLGSQMNGLATYVATNVSDADVKNNILSQINGISNTLSLIDLDSFTANLDTVVGYLTSVENGMDQIINSTDYQTLSDGLTALSKGASDLANGSREFSKGLATLSASTNTIKGYTNSLYDGSLSLVDGASKLSSGLTEFDAKGIKTLSSLVNNDVKTAEAKLRKMVKLGEDYDTFTKKSAKMDGETKFIVIIDGEN